MAQPICVMYIPDDLRFAQSDRQFSPSEIMYVLNGWGSEKYQPKLPLGGYLWLVFYKKGIDAPELKTFYEKDMTPIQYEEIKRFILNNATQKHL